MESDSTRPKSKYQRQRLRVHQRRRGRRMGRRIALGAAVLLAILGVGGAGVWTVMYFAKPSVDESQQPPPPPPEPPEPRLIGIWISDIDATIAELKSTRKVSDEDELKLRRNAMVVTYTPETITMDMGGAVGTQPYEVVSQDADGVVIKFQFDPKKEPEEVRIRFVSDKRYWLEFRKVSAYFRRIGK